MWYGQFLCLGKELVGVSVVGFGLVFLALYPICFSFVLCVCVCVSVLLSELGFSLWVEKCGPVLPLLLSSSVFVPSLSLGVKGCCGWGWFAVGIRGILLY